jgi:hypothetical protein
MHNPISCLKLAAVLSSTHIKCILEVACGYCTCMASWIILIQSFAAWRGPNVYCRGDLPGKLNSAWAENWEG